MYTQCPKCHTIFNVTREILEIKAGLVRCGDCENVFNATWNLVDDATDQQHETDFETPSEGIHDASGGEWAPADSEPAPGPHSPREDAARDDPNDSEPLAEDISDEEIRRTLRLDEDFSSNIDLDLRSREDQQTRADSPRPGSESIVASIDARLSNQPFEATGNRRLEPRLDPTTPGDLSVDAQDALLPRRPSGGIGARKNRPSLRGKPAIQLKARPRQDRPAPGQMRVESNINWVSLPGRENPGSRWLWASGIMLLVVLAILQVRFLLVEELYSIPATRPYISTLCALAGCSPPARSDPASIRIAQTRVDLHPEVPGAMRVRVNLVNQAEFAQPYPAIQLTLSDKDGRIVGRRTYAPAEYLDAGNRGTLLDPGVLAVASINLANPNEIAVGFEAVVVAGPAG